MPKIKQKTTKTNRTRISQLKNDNSKQSTPRVQRVYQRFKYSPEDLRKAFEDAKEGKLSINKACEQYNIPKGTLVNKLRVGNPSLKPMGPQSVLDNIEESMLKQWILDKAHIGYPMHPTIVKQAVKSVLDRVPRPNPFVDNLPGYKWLRLFLKRHPEIKLKNTEILSKTRASVTEDNIREWFQGLHAYLEKEDALDIFTEPSRIYNLDETGVQLCPRTGKLLGAKKEKNVYYISPGKEKECITVLCTYSADGKEIAPMIVYPYKRFPPKDVASSVPDGFITGHSPSGWMTIETYNSFMENGFYRELVKRNIKFPVLLLFDGHSSHVSLKLHEFCREKRILLYCLYPNATHIIQPCDVGIFRSLKKFWKQEVSRHAQNSTKIITKVNFAPIFKLAYDKAANEQVIKNAFECCGLYPFNPDRVDYSKCMSNRHKEIRKNRETVESGCDTPAFDMISNIEADIPVAILAGFEEAYRTDTLPVSETILFKMWRKLKYGKFPPLVDNDNLKDSEKIGKILEEISENIVASEDLSEDMDVENMQIVNGDALDRLSNFPKILATCDSDLLNNAEYILQPCDLALLNADVLSVDYDKDDDQLISTTVPTELIVMVTSDVLSSESKSFESSKSLSTLNSTVNLSSAQVTTEISIPATSNVFPTQNQIPLLVENASVTDTLSSDSMDPMDLSKKSNKLVSPTTKDSSSQVSANISVNDQNFIESISSTQSITEQASSAVFNVLLTDSLNVENHIDLSQKFINNPDPSKHVKNHSDEKLLISQISSSITPDKIKKECLDHVWKQELHFPTIVSNKNSKKSNKKVPIFAISSEEWKIEHERKKKEEDELNKQKELKKFEREIKRKIKLEEVEKKKKEMQARKELALKKKQEKEKEKHDLDLMLKQQAEILGLENYTTIKHISKKRIKREVLNDITNDKKM